MCERCKASRVLFIEAVTRGIDVRDLRTVPIVQTARKIAELQTFGMSVAEATTAIHLWILANDQRWDPTTRECASFGLEMLETAAKYRMVDAAGIAVIFI